jgi:hypothetical protein
MNNLVTAPFSVIIDALQSTDTKHVVQTGIHVFHDTSSEAQFPFDNLQDLYTSNVFVTEHDTHYGGDPPPPQTTQATQTDANPPSPQPLTEVERRAASNSLTYLYALYITVTLLFGVIFACVWQLIWPRSLDAVNSAAVAAVTIVFIGMDHCNHHHRDRQGSRLPGYIHESTSRAAATVAIFAIVWHFFSHDSLGTMSAVAAAAIVIVAATAAIVTAGAVGLIVTTMWPEYSHMLNKNDGEEGRAKQRNEERNRRIATAVI